MRISPSPQVFLLRGDAPIRRIGLLHPPLQTGEAIINLAGVASRTHSTDEYHYPDRSSPA